jgi:hypothetical protein
MILYDKDVYLASLQVFFGGVTLLSSTTFNILQGSLMSPENCDLIDAIDEDSKLRKRKRKELELSNCLAGQAGLCALCDALACR